ncbi:MAG: hypothetical protein ACYDGO_12250 [Smithellaceae bacterium]
MYTLINIKRSGKTLVDCTCRHALRNGQKGALLIGLIITMVILSALSGGVVYIFSSSTLNPISGNYAQRAYYNAEAGFRYMTSLYRSGNTTEFNTYVAAPKTLSLPDGGTTTVQVTTPIASATANTSAAGGGSSLALSSTTGFPSPKGFFTIGTASTVYRYTGVSGTTLNGIYPNTGPVASGVAIKTKEQVTITSKGTFGSGLWNVSRTVIYAWPLSLSAADEISADSPAAGVNPGSPGSNWNAPSAGAFTVDTGTGQPALKLIDQSSYSCGSSPITYFSLMSLNWGTSFANFSKSWSGNGKTLSYDAQVKMKLHQLIGDGTTYRYYMAGMVFRLGTTGNVEDVSTLGVSFLRGRNGTDFWGNDRDYIEDGVVPINDLPLIVLWQKNGCGLQWIAYKVISPTFDTGNGTLTNAGSPHYVIGATSRARGRVTVSTSNNGVTGYITGISDSYSTFQDGEQLVQLTRQNSLTAQVNTPISPTKIDFDNGENSVSNTGILVGDFIVGGWSGATATVESIKTTGSGTWGNGNAKGTIDFVGTSVGTFLNNETLQIYRPGTTPVATYRVGLSDVLTSANMQYIKDWSTLVLRIAEKQATEGPFTGSYVNNIQIYLGDANAHGTPTGSPLDILRLTNPRWSNPVAAGDVQWPPDAGWSLVPLDATKDHFTLVQGWVVNPAVSSSFARIDTGEGPTSIIQTNTFTTHGLTTFTQQELGLQVAGSGMATYGTYFEDFAIKLKGSVGYISPLQN